MNEYSVDEPRPVDTLVIDEHAQQELCEKLKRLRERRNSKAVRAALAELERCARGMDNLMIPILECVRAYATLGEMCDILRSVFGEYREPPLY